MKALTILDFSMLKRNCDWIIGQATEVNALLGYNSETMIGLNKTRVLKAIETMETSLMELKSKLESV